MWNPSPRVALTLVAALAGAAGFAVAGDSPKREKPDRAAIRKAGRQLLTKYRAEYRRFVSDAVRTKSKPAADRVRVQQRATAAVNAIFKDHVKSPSIAVVLPELAKAKAVDLTPTLTAIVRQNPDRNIQAIAAYTLACHLHNNNGDEKRAIALLEALRKRFPKVPFEDGTLGVAAGIKLYEIQHLSVGKLAPDVQGEDADGAKFRISDYRGKVIVLRFWGDWCPFCRSMFPQERELVKTLADKPFVLLGVNSDPRPRLKKAQREKNLVWRSFWDGGTTTGPIAKSYHVIDWPTIYVIDHKGRIRAKGEGVRGGRAKWLEPVLKKLIAEAERDREVATK